MANVVTKKGVKEGCQVIIPCDFDDIKPAKVDGIDSKEIYITYDNDLCGLAKILNKEKGEVAYVENEYNSIGEFKNGVAIVAIYCERFGTRYGIIDTEFNEQLECIYDNIKWLSDKLLAIQKNGKFGLFSIDEMELILPTRFSSISYFSIGKPTIALEGKIILGL